MKFWLSIFLAVMMTPWVVFAIKQASKSEIVAIQDQIRAANRMDKTLKDAQIQLNRAERRNAPEEEIARRTHHLRREVDKQNAARTKAIHMTLDAYDLWPKSRRGTSIMSLTKDRTIHWTPVAREHEARQVEDAKGERVGFKRPPGNPSGVTYADGVTVIPPDALDKGPGFLASLLLHERTHFEQYITPGKGDKWSTAKLQAEAYKAEVDNSKYFFDSENEKDFNMSRDIKSYYIDNDAIAKREDKARSTIIGRIKHYLAPSQPPGFLPRSLHSSQELEALRKQSNDLVAIVAQEMKAVREQARRFRKLVEEQAKQRQAAEAEEEEARDHVLWDLWWVAKETCKLDGYLTDTDLAGVQYVSDIQFYRDALPDADAEWSYDPSCINVLYRDLLLDLVKGKRPTAMSLRSWVAIHPPPVPRLPTVKEMEASILAKAPPPPNAAGVLVKLAQKACAEPGGLKRSDLDVLWWFPSDALMFVGSHGKDLAGCVKELYLSFISFSRTWSDGKMINYRWINKKARRLVGESSGSGGGTSPDDDSDDGRGHDPRDIDLDGTKVYVGKLRGKLGR